MIVDGEIRSLLSIHSPVKRQWEEHEVAEAQAAADEIARIISS